MIKVIDMTIIIEQYLFEMIVFFSQTFWFDCSIAPSIYSKSTRLTVVTYFWSIFLASSPFRYDYWITNQTASILQLVSIFSRPRCRPIPASLARWTSGFVRTKSDLQKRDPPTHSEITKRWRAPDIICTLGTDNAHDAERSAKNLIIGPRKQWKGGPPKT